MNPAFRILIFMALLFQGSAVKASSSLPPDSLRYFKGRVLDSDTRYPLAFTHVINSSRKTATICDTLGYFYIRVRLLDSLQFSAIGYTHMQVVITDSLLNQEKLPDLPMNSTRYAIQGVMINPLGSYESFRRKVIMLELPPSGYEINPTVIFDIEQGMDTLDMLKVPVMSPVTALYNWLSKEGKSRRKLVHIQDQEQFEKDIEYKYSPMIVEGITAYSGFELYEFMEFCNFKKQFLLEADRYDVRDAILEKQKIFEALRKE